MKILELEVKGFRSLRELKWQPGDLNVVIGPNASGKSNLLRALEAINAAAAGHLGSYVQREGGMEPLVWDGRTEEIVLRFKTTPLPPYTDPSTDALTYELQLARLGLSSNFRVEREVLGNFCQFELGEISEPYRLLYRDRQHAVVYSMDSQRFERVAAVEVTQLLPEDETLLSFSSGPFVANQFVTGFQREVATWKIYQDFQTHHDAPIRKAQVTRRETIPNADGQNLVSVLHSLYTNDRDFEEELNTAMRAAFGDDFDKLVFPPAADQQIQMRVRWRSLRREQSTADLSDGTLRFLFLIAVLANPSPPPLIAIDEPETGLHPSMLPIVAEYARDAAHRTQVILTTHSPDLLDAFGDDPPTTTVCERENGATRLRVLSGEQLTYWLKEYSLGELYRSSQLESM